MYFTPKVLAYHRDNITWDGNNKNPQHYELDNKRIKLEYEAKISEKKIKVKRFKKEIEILKHTIIEHEANF